MDNKSLVEKRTSRKGAGAKKRQAERYRLKKEQQANELAQKISHEEGLFFDSNPDATYHTVGCALRRMDKLRNINPHIQFEHTDTAQDVRRRIENARFGAMLEAKQNSFLMSLRNNDSMIFERGVQKPTELIVKRFPFKKVEEEEDLYLEDTFLQTLFVSEPIESADLTTDLVLVPSTKKDSYSKWQRKNVVSTDLVPDKLVFASESTAAIPLVGVTESVPRAIVNVRVDTHVLLDHYWYHYYVWDSRFGHRSKEIIRFYDAECGDSWLAYREAKGVKYNFSRFLNAPGIRIKVLSIYQIRFLCERRLLLPRLTPPLFVMARDNG